MATTRTFIAVAATAAVRTEAVALIDVLRPVVPSAKWVLPENLHWTLEFLGEVEDRTLAAVCDQVAAAAHQHAPFSLEVVGVGAFPNLERPRTLWLGAQDGGAELTALQDSVEGALAELGFRGERRRYRPHLTLGRAGRGRDLGSLTAALDDYADLAAGRMRVEEVGVYGSELGRDGPKYHVVGRARLG